MEYPSHLYSSILPVVLVAFSLLSAIILLFSFYRRRITDVNRTQNPDTETLSTFERPGSKTIDKTYQSHISVLSQLDPSLRLEIVPSSNSTPDIDCHKSDCHKSDSSRPRLVEDSCPSTWSDRGKSCEGHTGKKKKKKGKKKRLTSQSPRGEDDDEEKSDTGLKEKQESLSTCPFTSNSSATQRKIKQQYDHLMKCHGSKGLTLAQVGQFADCLAEARNELQNKSEVIQRKFTITKALLFKAERSSFDRIRQQMYRLEVEQKRLEEDAQVYNWLQQELKLSPAYKKILEIGENLGDQASESGNPIEEPEADFTDISFEEFLAQEKKDSFWQKNGRLRTFSS